jgi:hypothetical protein
MNVVHAIEDFWFMTATLPESVDTAETTVSPRQMATAVGVSYAVS